MPSRRIGCLAWGSLLWDPRTLPLAGSFRDAGPRLPIEFSRVSLDGRVTLVIDAGAPEVETYWVPLEVESPEEAVAELAIREKIDPGMRSRWVGLQHARDRRLDAGDTHAPIRERIADWLGREALDAVVWTALPPRGPRGETSVPDFDTLLAHLRSLEGAAQSRAEEYIRRTPPKVRTPHRARFEEILGWVPAADGRASTDPG